MDRYFERRHNVEVKTFTVRDLDRTPFTVPDAADQDGAVRIKRRGRTYTIRADKSISVGIVSLSGLAERRRAIFAKRIPAKHVRKVDKLIAGE